MADNNTTYFSHRDNRANIYELQTYLRYLAREISQLQSVVPDGIYGPETRESVRAFQKRMGLPVTGEADLETWTQLVEAYDRAVAARGEVHPVHVYPLDVSYLKEGDDFEEIYILQIMLRRLAKIYGSVNMPKVTGVYDADTRKAVEDIARAYGKETNGTVDRELWNIIADLYSAFTFND